MKMNAKKLTLVLVALLLALTCVFVACNKDNNNETKPADGQQEQQTPAAETIAKEDLTKVAEQFKADFEAKFLGLYSTEVAKSLRAAEDEALLKIVAAKDKAEAEKIAAEYIAILEAAKTLADEVKALVTKIGDVALADEADINLMLDYDKTLNNELTAGATGAKKAVLDAYKADAKTQEAIKDLPARLAVLKTAKAAADAGINARIAAMLAKFQAEDAKLDLGDYNDYLVLNQDVASFVEKYDLEEGSDAYKEIVKADDLKTAKATFDTKTKDDAQIQRAIAVVNAADELEAAAAAAKNVAYVWVDADDLFFWDTTVYWMDQATFKASADVKTLKTGETLELVAYDGLGAEVATKFVNPAYTYPSVQAANDDEVWYLYQCQAPKKADYNKKVLADGETAYAKNVWATKAEALAAGAKNPIKVVDPSAEASYKLSLQPVVEKAAKAADAWKPYIPQEGTQAYRENIVLIAYYKTITNLVASYNQSLARAKEAYDTFAAKIVVKNYVDEYPEKGDTYANYALTTDTQTAKKYTGKLVWKEMLYNEIEKVMRTARTPITGHDDETYIRSLFVEGAYPFMAWFFKTNEFNFDGDALKRFSSVDVLKGEDGNYGLYLTYLAYSYRWKTVTVDRKEKVEVTADNTTKIENAYGYLAEAEAFLAWVEKYIGEDLPDTFDLTPYKTVALDGVNPDVKLGTDVLTFVDDKLEEIADAQIYKILGEAVDAKPTDALDITVYADYNVAKAIVAYAEALAAKKESDLKALDAAVMAIFEANETNTIAEAKALYTKALTNYGAEAITSWRKENSVFKKEYIDIINAAEALYNRALAIYPTADWAGLDGFVAAITAAEAKLTALDWYLKAFDLVLAKAEADLEYKKAGYAIGWTTTKTDENNVSYIPVDDTRKAQHEGELATYRLIEKEAVDAAQKKVDQLTEWRYILTFASKFISDNDSYALEYEQDPGRTRNVAYIDFANINATLADVIGTGTISYVVDDEAFAEEFGYELGEVAVFNLDGLVAKLAEIATDAKAVTKYHRDAQKVVVYDVETKLDQKASVKAVEAAKADYATALEGFLADFSVFTLNSVYDQTDASVQAISTEINDRLAEIDTLIKDIGAFLKTIVIGTEKDADGEDQPVYPDYLNLKWANAYTGGYEDLFSALFNARILATYYKSVTLTYEYADAAGKVALLTVDPNDDEHETEWVLYALKYIVKANSTAKFASFKGAVDTLKKTSRYTADDKLEYKWAANLINVELKELYTALAEGAFKD